MARWMRAVEYLCLPALLFSFAACESQSKRELSEYGANVVSEQPTKPAGYEGIVCEEVQVEMRDGVTLTTWVYRPEGDVDAKYPVIVVRNVYGQRQKVGCYQGERRERYHLTFAQNGYVAIEQATRGTYTSGGDRYRLARFERVDGYDTIEWAAKQPWSTGAVGLVGFSGLGITALQGTVAAPPSLKAAIVGVTAQDYFREWVYVNGVFHLGFNLSWAECCFAPDGIIRQGEADRLSQDEIDRQVAERAEHGSAFQEIYTDWARILPLTEMPHFRGIFDEYYDWLAHPTYDEYWAKIDAEAQSSRIEVPVLSAGAWQDLWYEATVNIYTDILNGSGPQSAKSNSRLVMQTYSHSQDHGTPSFVPGLNHPNIKDTKEFQIPFFDKYVKGLDNGYENKPAVELAVMVPPDKGNEGSSFVVYADEYPLPGTTEVSFYLSSDGNANTRSGNGVLSETPIMASGDIQETSAVANTGFYADKFVYDPMNPVPTLATHSCCLNEMAPGGYRNGFAEQEPIESRDDVLVYTSAPLTAPLTVIGPVEVRLFAKSSAPDTDFTAKLVDVRPDGATNNVLDGVVRARLRDGYRSQPTLIEPGKTYEYTIPLGPVAMVFPVGHRIRLQISSSNFPKLARNLNTGKSNETTAEVEIADQTILHDAEHPSRLTLSVVAGVNIPPVK